LILYYWPGSSSAIPHVILEEIGAPYERRLVNFAQGEHKSDAYLKINPRGKVPALAVDGLVLTDNVASLTYLALIEEARCISIMAWFASTIHPNFGRIIRPQRSASDPATYANLKSTARDAFWDNCREINQLLDGKEWTMGTQYTICDPYAFHFYDSGARINLPMHELAAYTVFSKRMLERPAVRKVHELEENLLKGANAWDGPYYPQPRRA
jgi:glutathione S-transferase